VLAATGESAKGLKKIKLTFARNGPSILAKPPSVFGRVVNPIQLTYSNIFGAGVASGRRLHASSNIASG